LLIAVFFFTVAVMDIAAQINGYNVHEA